MNGDVGSDLVQRHRTTSRIIQALLVLTLLLILVAFLGKSRFGNTSTSSLDIPVKITIVIFGLGAVALRRTRFSAMRLQDLGALGIPTALLKTMEKTTIQLGVLAGLLVITGFIATILTSNDFYTYGAGLIAVVVLLYAYPTRSSWERIIRRFVPDYEESPGKNVLS
jgi:peptidoglycan/LPS O-acetylase OafA/YrhL